MLENSGILKRRLRQKEILLGSWITIGNTTVAEIMARSGFDWLVIDLEHSMISLDMAGDLIRVIDLCGVSPLVRLTSNDTNQIKRVMDAGAHGVVVPSVNSAEEAMLAVSATRYPPIGTRGVGLGRAQKYGIGFEEHLKWQADGPLVIVMIEHKNALENIEDILHVRGVDGFIVGPYDLSCSLGIPGDFSNPLFISALKRIRLAGELMGCPTGLHVVEPSLSNLKKAISDGYQLIAYGVDMRFLDKASRAGVSHFKEVLK